MGAYDVIDTALKGLKYGLDSRIEGGWACQESAGIEFGAPVMGYVGDEKKAYNFYLDVGKIVYDADFVTSNSIAVTVNGVAITPVVFTTDHDTTVALVVAAIAGLTGVEAVLDTTDTDSRTILVRTKGATTVASSAVTLGASQAGVTVTYDSGQVLLGVAMFIQNQQKLYAQYDAVNVLAYGQIWIEAGATVEANEVAYLTTAGAWGIAGNAINGSYKSNATSGNLARVFIEDQQTKLTYASAF